ncbi:outer membrane protein assembly factor BamA [Leadbettera azotonutricia]|uniref:Outer membrane protein assembly factor BamA n=1 Tax=Leadbettera azotonutricia (strain ATCC BAA-888 / DSM 13862 / ZAS-9) TaxID=545695 RepID=F5YBM4_LEAAZ|nr:outer membrane protein assembly factor BamA [Leadbettera azotonutricia]AEF82334.1 outer membrane protein assembly complex, YaeT protein [Leadbettera azotonutricia ZAS-9]
MRFRFLVLLLAAVTVFSVFPQDVEWYQGKPIKNIVFDGLNNVKSNELDGITEPYLGQSFGDDVYWEILGKLYALEYFETINPTALRADTQGNEVILRFTVTERPQVSRINFVGNSGLRRNELLDTVTLKIHDVATQAKLRVDELAITNKYLEKGFPDIKVRSEMVPGANGSLVVNFYVEEGEKITIEEFRFEGNSVFSARTLQRQLTLKTKGIIADGAFQEAKLIADRQALTQYYHDRGYIDAEIVDVSREIRKDEKGGNNLTITFRLYEGRIYNFGGITFEGNKIFTTEQLAALVYSKVGDVVSDKKIQADLMRVTDLYLENGYLFNRIEPVPNRDASQGLLTFNIMIVERGRAHIENIIVRGNEKTKDNVILREIPLEAGDIFSKAKVMDGLRNLYNLQYFSNVIPDTPVGSSDALMDLVINVEEQPTTDVQFGLTFSGSSDPDAFPISGMVRWNDRNFRGSGNQIGAEVNASPDTQSASLDYTQRWIFGLPLSGSFDFTVQHTKRLAAMDNMPPYFNNDDSDKAYAFPDGFGSREEYVEAGKIPSSEFLLPYNQWRLSLGVSTGYRWSTFVGNLTLSGGVRLGIVRSVFDSDLYRPFDPVLRNENNIWTPATSVWTSLALDQRDVYYDPSKGYYGIQRIGYYGLLGIEQEHYVRTDTKAEWYITMFNIPITDNWAFKAVFGIHSGLSFIFRQPFNDAPIIEEANQLAVDGMFVGRGWSGEYSRKGFALWENWAEIRLPVVPGILAWDFFFDAAGVKAKPGDLFSSFGADDQSSPDFSTFFMRFSFGGGFRFTIPQFPFRFSLAKRFLIQDGSVKWQGGAIGRNSSNPAKGLDFVISFALSTY